MAMMIADRRGAVCRLLLLLVASILLALPAVAHRLPEVVGTVVHDEDGGEPITKVTWRLHAEDALGVLEQIPEVSRVNLEEEANLIELAGYVASWVEYSDGEAVTLGAEVDGDFAYVYQLVPGHVTVTRAGVLSDFDPAWWNLVNVEQSGGVISSLSFTRDYPEGTTLKLDRDGHTH